MQQQARTYFGHLGVPKAEEHLVEAPISRSPGTRLQQTCGKNLVNSHFEVAG
jgi:hypothetical protein